MEVKKIFKEMMDQFIEDIRKDINNTFSNEDFEKEKNLIKQEFEQRRTNLLEKLNRIQDVFRLNIFEHNY